MAQQTTFSVDVWFDLICPWCWIGKHNLDRALKRLQETDSGLQVEVSWHSVQLIPQTPSQGWPYDEFYEKRLGGREAMLARRAQVQEAAERAGAPIDYTRLTVFPSTAAAHQLLAAGRAQLTPAAFDALLTRLFEGYFVGGENLGDAGLLESIAAEHGVLLDGARLSAAPQQGDELAARSGVPFFLFNGTHALAGAQPAEVLWGAMRQAAAASCLQSAPD
ncbi:hypothetical protein GCM10010975_22740 [Comamonas phosphati]|nr:hypothetical protein GCM10010975_22740 [Comamonas phosphati]